MLTFRRPFEGEDPHEVLKKILFDEPLDPRRVNPRVPRDLAVICLKAMDKKQDGRYETMRKLSEESVVKKAMDTLKGRARVKRTMWSRRAQEYVAKINSGDLISIAEVVRDLYRSEAQPDQSYSERQLYEDALDRMAREIAAVEKLDERCAVQRITEVLSKSARGRRLAAEEAESGGDDAETQAA